MRKSSDSAVDNCKAKLGEQNAEIEDFGKRVHLELEVFFGRQQNRNARMESVVSAEGEDDFLEIRNRRWITDSAYAGCDIGL